MESIKLRLKDYIKDIDENIERRYNTTSIKFARKKRDDGGDDEQDEGVLEGYAAVFDSDSEDFGGWVERIAPGAFDDVLEDNAFALFNHSMNLVLGRNKVNLSLSTDKTGLLFNLKVPDTSLGNDIKTLVKNDILNKCSFAFTVEEESFTKGSEIGKAYKPAIRTVQKIAELFDVSIVTMPAYPDTSVASRSFKKLSAIQEIRMALTEQQAKLNYLYIKNKLNFK